MTGAVTITLDLPTAAAVRSALKKRTAELDNYLQREGETLTEVEYLLARDVRADMARGLAAFDAALKQKERA